MFKFFKNNMYLFLGAPVLADIPLQLSPVICRGLLQNSLWIPKSTDAQVPYIKWYSIPEDITLLTITLSQWEICNKATKKVHKFIIMGKFPLRSFFCHSFPGLLTQHFHLNLISHTQKCASKINITSILLTELGHPQSSQTNDSWKTHHNRDGLGPLPSDTETKASVFVQCNPHVSSRPRLLQS